MAFNLPDAAKNLLPGDLISKAAGSPGESEVGAYSSSLCEGFVKL